MNLKYVDGYDNNGNKVFRASPIIGEFGKRMSKRFKQNYGKDYKMMTAEEANKRTTKNLEDGCAEELEGIMKSIEEKIDNGEYTLSISGDIHKGSINKLRSLGYEVELENYYNGSYVIISWRK